MVNPEDFKKKIKQIISQEYCIEFLGSDFDQIASSMSESSAEKIYSWAQQVVVKKIQPIFIGSKKQVFV